METLKYRRILLKLSGEALGAPGDEDFFDRLNGLAQRIGELVRAGVKLGIVVGGGNIWRARHGQSFERNRADHMGMLATAINGLALQDALLRADVPCRVLSAVSMERFCDTFTSRLANELLDEGTVVIFACGSGSPFFTTDTAASLRACEIGADALLLAKNVDAIYDKNPDEYPDAVRLTHPTYDEILAKNIRALDLTAVTMCKEAKIPIAVFALRSESSIMDACMGKNIGTLVDS